MSSKKIVKKMIGDYLYSLLRYIYQDPKNVVLSLFFTVKYIFINKLYSKPLGAKEGKSVLVTLTTYHKRISTVYLTIESIFDQSYAPTDIILWLSQDDIPQTGLPKSLVRLQKRGLKINVVDSNYKSYKKLSHVIEDDIIRDAYECYVTADDDIFYPKTWLKGLVESYLKNPNVVHCYRGHDCFNDTQDFDYNHFFDCNTSQDQPSNNLLPTGVSGILYPKESLCSIAYDFDTISKLCPHADDIWYKLITSSRGFKSKRVKFFNVDFPMQLNCLELGLSEENVLSGKNDLQYNQSISSFPKSDFRAVR